MPVYRGYGEMGLFALNNPVEVAIAVWPWGAYLGEEALEALKSLHETIPNTLAYAAMREKIGAATVPP